MTKDGSRDYISTADALGELLGADPQFRQLLTKLHSLKGKAWSTAHAKYSVRRSELFALFLAELKAGVLRPVVIARAEGGNLASVQFLGDELNTLVGELALDRGLVLEGQYRDLPLCLQRHEWKAWLTRYTRRRGVSAAAVRRGFQKWAKGQLGPIVLRQAWKAMKELYPGVPRDLVEKLLKELPSTKRRTKAGRPPQIHD